jgi:outer membrane murein-binding lipoprotein Lpp
MTMQKTIRRALVIAAIYLAGSYVLDRPEQAKQDAVALGEMAANLPEPVEVVESFQQTGQVAGDTIWDAKQRLDSVRGSVQHSIALGSERFGNSD